VSRRPTTQDPSLDTVAGRIVDIGRHLREARQQRGEDLYDVADYLRIKPSYLFALEEGDLRSMPGQTYAMGFLRTYADHLGYDGAEVVRGLRSTSADEPAEALHVRQPVAENRLPSLGIVLMALLLAGFAYGGWFVAQSGNELLSQLRALPGAIGQHAAQMFEEEDALAAAESSSSSTATQPAAVGDAAIETSTARGTGGQDEPVSTDVPIRAVQAGEVPAGVTAAPLPGTRTADITNAIAATASTGPAAAESFTLSGNSSASANGAVVPGSDAEPGAEVDTLASLMLDAESERDAALRRLEAERPEGGTVGDLLAGLEVQTDPAAAAAATTPLVNSSTGRVVLVAREDSWIQIQSPARDFIRSMTLEAGDRFEIPDRTDLALWTGNAGGLEVWVDGQSVGVLGQSGAVLRDVSLAPQALLARP